MPDTPTPQPVQMSFMSALLTAGISSTGGEQIGEQLGDTMAWLVGLACHCTPPTQTVGLFHSLSTFIVVVLAFVAHYYYLKLNQKQ